MIKALIIGSGVAGPVAAMALLRGGIEAAVYEAHIPSNKDVGSYLTVATNGLGALRALDAHKPVQSAGFSTSSIVLLNDAGVRLGRVPAGSALPDGTVSITIKRARLHRVLLEQATNSGIPFEFGKRLTSAEATPDGSVNARFEDGTHATGDLLIGCDGVHSITRRIIDPTAPVGRYVGLVNFGGYTRDLANFLLMPGFDMQSEILDQERLLIANGETPSIFFRFPGLVSDAALMHTNAVHSHHACVVHGAITYHGCVRTVLT
jgi:2-polyprenyl-6-methoxyphenol hydroxylase-like FAD-dependent oxidoreductase